jgi:hypothetical protein
MSDEIDPSWPPPAPKSSEEHGPSWTPPPEAAQTAAVPTPQQPAPWPPASRTSTERENSPSSRSAWQRPVVFVPFIGVITALIAIAATVAIIHTHQSTADNSAQGAPGTVGASPQLPTTVTPTSSTTAAVTSTPQAAGSNTTIADYIKENGIAETPVHRGDAGGPTINLPLPTGWADAGKQTPNYAYGEILDNDPAMASDPPTIVTLVSKLTGDVDPAKILELAPGEMKNLPGYEAMGDGSASTLSGFSAYQIGGTYQKNGEQRVVAQKTVVIPSAGGLYVLQLNAEGTQDQMPALMEATDTIDEQTTITA